MNVPEHTYEPHIGPETAEQAFRRRTYWRSLDLKDAWREIARARAFRRGKRRLGGVPVYLTDASEENIDRAIKRLNCASWNHHQGGQP